MPVGCKCVRACKARLQMRMRAAVPIDPWGSAWHAMHAGPSAFENQEHGMPDTSPLCSQQQQHGKPCMLALALLRSRSMARHVWDFCV
eukprot:83910-Chlamydomonas_euryale.AAC.2